MMKLVKSLPTRQNLAKTPKLQMPKPQIPCRILSNRLKPCESPSEILNPKPLNLKPKSPKAAEAHC